MIGSVEPGSPAALAGLAPGDRVAAVAGTPVALVGRRRRRGARAPGRERSPSSRSATASRTSVALAVEPRASIDEVGQPVAGRLGRRRTPPRRRRCSASPTADSPAYAGGAALGRRRRRVGDTPVESWEDLASAYAAARSTRQRERRASRCGASIRPGAKPEEALRARGAGARRPRRARRGARERAGRARRAGLAGRAGGARGRAT